MKRLWEVGLKPIVLAHRGGGNEAVENSLDAFEAMVRKGFRYIETDSHATSDDVVVLFHDDVLDRTTNGTGAIGGYSWEMLSQIRDHSGNMLVRLSDALEHFPSVTFNIDAKSWHVVEPLARTIRDADAVNHVSLASFSEARLKKLRRLLPGVRSSLGTGAIAILVAASRLPYGIGRFVARLLVPGSRQGVQAVQVPRAQMHVRVVTPSFIRLSHSLGLAVHVWTINSERAMRELLDMGVDGIITDEPSLAQRVIDDYWSQCQS